MTKDLFKAQIHKQVDGGEMKNRHDNFSRGGGKAKMRILRKIARARLKAELREIKGQLEF